jgi:hypothetical protein
MIDAAGSIDGRVVRGLVDGGSGFEYPRVIER